MNLRQKEELKNKLDSLSELFTCVDKEFIHDNEYHEYHKTAIMVLSNMNLMSRGESLTTLNILLHALGIQIKQLQNEMEIL